MPIGMPINTKPKRPKRSAWQSGSVKRIRMYGICDKYNFIRMAM